MDCVVGSAALLPGVIVNAAGYTAVDRAEAKQIARAASMRVAGTPRRGMRAFRSALIHIPPIMFSTGASRGPIGRTIRQRPLQRMAAPSTGENSRFPVPARALIFRTSGLWRPGDNFVKRILRLARERTSSKWWPIRSVARPSRSCFHGDRACLGCRPARGLLAVGEARLYHFCGAAHPLSWYEFARTIVGLAARRGFAFAHGCRCRPPILTGGLRRPPPAGPKKFPPRLTAGNRFGSPDAGLAALSGTGPAASRPQAEWVLIGLRRAFVPPTHGTIKSFSGVRPERRRRA